DFAINGPIEESRKMLADLPSDSVPAGLDELIDQFVDVRASEVLHRGLGPARQGVTAQYTIDVSPAAHIRDDLDFQDPLEDCLERIGRSNQVLFPPFDPQIAPFGRCLNDLTGLPAGLGQLKWRSCAQRNSVLLASEQPPLRARPTLSHHPIDHAE